MPAELRQSLRLTVSEGSPLSITLFHLTDQQKKLPQ